MGRFLGGRPVRVGGPWWRPDYRFAEGAIFQHGAVDSAWFTVIPAAFVFNNSAPWWIAWALPRSRMLRACGLHDYLRTLRNWSLSAGDGAFLDAASSDRVREPWLTPAWWAVRTNKNRG